MNDRGQTAVDFAIAAAIFLLVVSGLILTVQGEFRTTNNDDHLTQTQRVSDQLATQLLVGDTGSLDEECTRAFFDKYSDSTLDTAPNDEVDCDVSLSASSLNAAVGVQETRNIEISIRSTDGTVQSIDGQQLLAGETANGEDTTRMQQVTTLNGQTVLVVVHLW